MTETVADGGGRGRLLPWTSRRSRRPARPAGAGLRLLDPRRARRRARGGPRGDHAAAAHAGHVRARRAPAPAAGALPVVPGAERRLRGRLRRALRLGRSGQRGVGAGGRVPAVGGPAPAALRQDARAWAGTPPDRADRADLGGVRRLDRPRTGTRRISGGCSPTTSPCCSPSASTPPGPGPRPRRISSRRRRRCRRWPCWAASASSRRCSSCCAAPASGSSRCWGRAASARPGWRWRPRPGRTRR